MSSQAVAGASSANFNLNPIIPVVGQILGEVNVIRPLKTALNCLDSSPLMNVSFASVKNVPYGFFGDNKLIQQFDNALSSRMRYAECAWMSTASLVYNCAFAVVFTAVTLLTLGQVKMLREQATKHWTHVALAVMSAVTATLGVLSPRIGIVVNGAMLYAVGFVIYQSAEGDVIAKLRQAYHRHRQELSDAIVQGLGGDRAAYNREFVPLLGYLDSHLTEDVTTFGDVVNVIAGAREHLPSVMPTASPEDILLHLRRFAANVNPGREEQASPVAHATVVEG